MIASHVWGQRLGYYRVLNTTFVHIIKTGGTSIDRILQQQAARQAPLLGRLKDRVSSRCKPKGRSLRHLSKHALAIDYYNCDSTSFLSTYSFAFVRNPWDWLVSWYSFVKFSKTSPDRRGPWRHALEPMIKDLSFESYIRWITHEHGLSLLPSRQKSSLAGKLPVLQSDWLTDADGKQMIDFVGRFENLQTDLRTALAGQPWASLAIERLPRLNESRRRNYQSYYTSETRELVAQYFAADIERFGYRY